MAVVSGFAYRAEKTVIHNLPALWKLAFLIAVTTVSFIDSWWAKAAALALILSVALPARLSPRTLLEGSRPLISFTLFVVILRALTLRPSGAAGELCLPGFPLALESEGLTAGLKLFSAVILAYAAGGVLFCTTTSRELRGGLSRLEGLLATPLARLLSLVGFKTAAARLMTLDLTLPLALSLSFLPRIFDVYSRSEEAWRARGGKRGIGGMMVLLPLVLERLIETAVETAYALEARGARASKPGDETRE